MNRDVIVQALRASLPELLSIHAFGSRIQGTAGPVSDLDSSMLVAGHDGLGSHSTDNE